MNKLFNIQRFANIGNSYSNNTLVSGSTSDDSIKNWASNNVTINADAGDDYIYNSGYNVTINGGKGDDYVYSNWNSGNVKINGDSGNDTISLDSSSKYNIIQYANGDGNDTIFGFNSDDTIQITNGNYSTLKSGNNFIISVGSGSLVLKGALTNSYNKIHIQNSSGIVNTYNDWNTWNGSSGDDEFYNYEHSVKINLNAGNDSISNDGNFSTIDSGVGNDSIYNDGSNVRIDSGDGNDYISNYGKAIKINAGGGNDTIDNRANCNSISAGSGDDSIYNYGSNVTINAGTGNDKISLWEYSHRTKIQYFNGDGNDTIYGFKEDDTLQISGAKYTTAKSGSDLIVSVGNGKITLLDAAYVGVKIDEKWDSGDIGVWIDNDNNNTLLNGTSYNDSIFNDGSNATIDALAGNDSIENDREFVLINGGDGNDSIYNNWGNGRRVQNTTINAGAGDDFIDHKNAYNVTISAGAGND